VGFALSGVGCELRRRTMTWLVFSVDEGSS
jgi:hypothetical protein